MRTEKLVSSILLGCLGFLIPSAGFSQDQPAGERRLLYVATPGIRDELQYGGHGVLVFDIDRGHKFVKRIPFGGLDQAGRPLNVKGIAASASTGWLYVTTLEHLICIGLKSERVHWEKSYEGGCDRLALSPDGKTIYLPSLEKDHWNVVDAEDGKVMAKIVTNSGAHNTIYGPDGRKVYMAGLKSPLLRIADTEKHQIEKTVGPFSNVIRPFTVNGSQTLCFVNVNNRLGFEVGDLRTGKVLHQVDVTGYQQGPVKRHGCPCHGIGLTPDGKELWLVDGANCCVHVFDAKRMPPKQTESIKFRDQPGWITFSIDGRFAYPSTGDIVDTKTHKVVGGLRDEKGRDVQSEKLLEIDFRGNEPVRAGNQFGISRGPFDSAKALGKNAISPADAAKEEGNARIITVEFLVKSCHPVVPDGKCFRLFSKPSFTDKDVFAVHLTEKAVKKLGNKDLKELYLGKKIRVTGKVQGVVFSSAARTCPGIFVDDPDNVTIQ